MEADGPTINKWLTSPSENMQPTRRTMENKLKQEREWDENEDRRVENSNEK